MTETQTTMFVDNKITVTRVRPYQSFKLCYNFFPSIYISCYTIDGPLLKQRKIFNSDKDKSFDNITEKQLMYIIFNTLLD